MSVKYHFTSNNNINCIWDIVYNKYVIKEPYTATDIQNIQQAMIGKIMEFPTNAETLTNVNKNFIIAFIQFLKQHRPVDKRDMEKVYANRLQEFNNDLAPPKPKPINFKYDQPADIPLNADDLTLKIQEMSKLRNYDGADSFHQPPPPPQPEEEITAFLDFVDDDETAEKRVTIADIEVSEFIEPVRYPEDPLQKILRMMERMEERLIRIETHIFNKNE